MVVCTAGRAVACPVTLTFNAGITTGHVTTVTGDILVQTFMAFSRLHIASTFRT